MVDAYDDHLHERDNVPEQGIEIQGMIDACQQSVSENPNNPYYIYQLAQAYYNYKDYA